MGKKRGRGRPRSERARERERGEERWERARERAATWTAARSFAWEAWCAASFRCAAGEDSNNSSSSLVCMALSSTLRTRREAAVLPATPTREPRRPPATLSRTTVTRLLPVLRTTRGPTAVLEAPLLLLLPCHTLPRGDTILAPRPSWPSLRQGTREQSSSGGP